MLVVVVAAVTPVLGMAMICRWLHCCTCSSAGNAVVVVVAVAMVKAVVGWLVGWQCCDGGGCNCSGTSGRKGYVIAVVVIAMISAMFIALS